MFKSNKAWQTLAVVAVFVLSLPMTACSQSSSVRSGEQWQPVCLDRFVIEVPPSVEVGASNVVYQGGYNFPGVKSIGATGIKWNGVMLDETHATDAQGLEVFHTVARRRVGDPKSLQKAIDAYLNENRIWTKRLNNGTTEEKKSAQEFIDENNQSIVRTRRSYKVSGFASVDTSDAFAMRDDDGYKIGYLDPTDHRVRYFEGQLSPSEAAIESPEAAAQEYERFGRLIREAGIKPE